MLPTMTVAQLIERLQKFPSETRVYLASDHLSGQVALQVYRGEDGTCRVWGNGYGEGISESEEIVDRIEYP